jgi:hypothetical protein
MEEMPKKIETTEKEEETVETKEGIKNIIDCDADPSAPYNWIVKEHQKCGQLRWNPAKVHLWIAGARLLKGEELREKLVGKPVLNANVLDYLLAHPELIPEEWKDKDVFFWGTIYSNDDRHLCVRFLYWHGDRWDWNDRWLAYDWHDDDPAALCAS